MKKLLAALAMVLLPTSVFAAGTVTQTLETIEGSGVKKLTLSWTADAAAATVPATATAWPINGYILHVVTNPGTTAPTDDYNITLLDSDTSDAMGGALLLRDEANTENVAPTIPYRFVAGKLTFTLADNAVNSAVGECIIYFVP